MAIRVPRLADFVIDSYRIRQPVALGVAVTLLLAVAAPIQAATVQQLSLRELCDRAELIVRGHVLASTAQTEANGRIVTHHRIRIGEVHKAPRGNDAVVENTRITVVTLGGTDGERRQHVPGEARLTRRAEVYLFLVRRGEDWRPLGLAQGALHVVTPDDNDAEQLVEQRLAGLTLVDPDGNEIRNPEPLRLKRPRFRKQLAEALNDR